MNEIKSAADVIILGAGPAGMSAAVWCADLGLSTIVFEKEAEAGGQLLRIYNRVSNYLGLETENGRELRDHFLHNFNMAKPLTRMSAEIAEVDPNSRSVTTVGGDRLHAQSLIIATGVRRRKLNIPGEDTFVGKGIIDSGSNEKEKALNKTAVIVGGGDAALENALILSEYAARICVVHRGPRPRARPEFTQKAEQDPKVEFRSETVVQGIFGGPHVETVELTNVRTGSSERIPADIVLFRIGVEPNSELLKGRLDLDSKGYIRVNSNCETSAGGVYAVGDVANPTAPTISSAAGMGATAAKAIKASIDRTRSAE